MPTTNTAALTGKDTVIINGRVMVDGADGNVFELTYPNDIAAVKTGKNGNSLYALNESGRQADGVLRLVRGSDDDKFLQALMATQFADFPAFVLLQGQFVKRIGDGNGDITNEIYKTSGGVFTKNVPMAENVEGDTNQGVAVYPIKFANATRTLT